MKQRQRTANSSPLGMMTNFSISQGLHRAQAIGKGKAIPGAMFYDVRVTEEDPTVVENYVHFDSYPGCSHMEFNNLTPTKQYSFCVRGRSSKSTGPWSSPVTIIAT